MRSGPSKLLVGDLLFEDRIVRGGGVLIRGESIAVVAERPEELQADEVLDYSGCMILPGLVDSHIHARSTPLEGLTRATAAAAAGGVTTVIDMPYDFPVPIQDVDELETKVRDIAAQAVIDVGLYGTMPKHDGVKNLVPLAEAGVCAFKFSMFEVDPQRLPRIDNGDLLKAFQILATTDIPIVVHAEDQEIVAAVMDRVRQGPGADWAKHAKSRPVVAETSAMAVLLELAYWTGARLHIAHVTHPHGFWLISNYRNLGARVSGETCIQYLTLTDEKDVATWGPIGKVNPPIRDQDAQDGLWRELGRGHVASISSDHAPWPSERKQKAMLDAASGIPGLETLLPALWTAAIERGVDLPFVIGHVTWRPADFYGFGARKGRLRAGFDADVCVFDSRQPWTYDAGKSCSVAGSSPFSGRAFAGRVIATYLRGNQVYKDGIVVAPPGTGRWLKSPAASSTNPVVV